MGDCVDVSIAMCDLLEAIESEDIVIKNKKKNKLVNAAICKIGEIASTLNAELASYVDKLECSLPIKSKRETKPRKVDLMIVQNSVPDEEGSGDGYL